MMSDLYRDAAAIVESWASRWRWYRRWCGGHWERWWIDMPVASSMWLQNAHGERPGLGVIREACEDWTPRVTLPSTGSPYRDVPAELGTTQAKNGETK